MGINAIFIGLAVPKILKFVVGEFLFQSIYQVNYVLRTFGFRLSESFRIWQDFTRKILNRRFKNLDEKNIKTEKNVCNKLCISRTKISRKDTKFRISRS